MIKNLITHILFVGLLLILVLSATLRAGGSQGSLLFFQRRFVFTAVLTGKMQFVWADETAPNGTARKKLKKFFDYLL
ncbi:MAG: hypothetical protein LUG25_05525 [Oscillospiraceae bacterium]|nr:hypothetical protein [Oscillospiraceae bacterium]